MCTRGKTVEWIQQNNQPGFAEYMTDEVRSSQSPTRLSFCHLHLSAGNRHDSEGNP